MLQCAVVENWWNPEKPAEDREFPLNRLVNPLANSLRGTVEFVRHHQAAILHDMLDSTFSLAIVPFDDAFFAAWRGKWQVKAISRILDFQHQGVWFAVIARPEVAESQETKCLAKAFAKDGGVMLGKMECFPPKTTEAPTKDTSAPAPVWNDPDYGGGPPP